MNKAFHLKENLNLTLNESSFITIFVENSKIDINYELNNGDYNILVFNNTDNEVVLNENGVVTNSNVKITYLDLNSYNYEQTCNIDVNKDSSLNINSIYLGKVTKKIKFDLFNKESNSNIFINNNVVCLNDADFELDVIGNIVKGAKNSKCHQKSQCLTFEAPKKSKILPVLNIDENDVEASHSLSSGTIDEEVLFYMNSRGLTNKESLGLLLVSYLMPNEDFYKDYVEGETIKELADRKVNESCSM